MGQYALGALLLAVLPGLNTRFTLAYQLVSLLAVAMLLSATLAWLCKKPLALRRICRGEILAGEAFRYRVLSEEKTEDMAAGLLCEKFERTPLDYESWLQAEDEEGTLGFDRWTGYRRFQRMLRERRPEQAVSRLSSLASGSSHGGDDVTEQSFDMTVTFPRRGLYRSLGFRVLRPEPLGILRSLSFSSTAHEFLVLPAVWEVPRFSLPARGLQQSQEAMTHRVGYQGDLSFLREYRHGDPKKFIHWKSSAKTGELKVMELEEESCFRAGLVLDTRAPDDRIFDVAVSVVASLLQALTQEQTKVDFLFVEDRCHCLSLPRGSGLSLEPWRVLAKVQRQRPWPSSHGQASKTSALKLEVERRLEQMTSLILVCCEWCDELEQILERCLGCACPVVLVWVAEDPTPTSACFFEHPERLIHVHPERAQSDLHLFGAL